jgi:hypothetical protein
MHISLRQTLSHLATICLVSFVASPVKPVRAFYNPPGGVIVSNGRGFGTLIAVVVSLTLVFTAFVIYHKDVRIRAQRKAEVHDVSDLLPAVREYHASTYMATADVENGSGAEEDQATETDPLTTSDDVFLDKMA